MTFTDAERIAELEADLSAVTHRRDLMWELLQDAGANIAELTDQRDIARSAVNLLRAAVQEHHDRHYLPITHSANRPVVAVHDKALYDAAGIHHMKPEPFDMNPSWHRLAGMRAHWASKHVDAITVREDDTAHLLASQANAKRLAESIEQARDPVRVNDTPEQPSGVTV